jgi:hypothetical protein
MIAVSVETRNFNLDSADFYITNYNPSENCPAVSVPIGVSLNLISELYNVLWISTDESLEIIDQDIRKFLHCLFARPGDVRRHY